MGLVLPIQANSETAAVVLPVARIGQYENAGMIFWEDASVVVPGKMKCPE
jgi:hypothetical protein